MKISHKLVTVSAVVIALGLSACGSHSTATIAKISCATKMVKWYHGGGKADLVILNDAVKPMVTAAENHKKGELNKDASVVQAASKRLNTNLPPNCVPGLDTQISALLTDANASATDAKTNNLKSLTAEGQDAKKHFHKIIIIGERYVK